MFVTINTFGFFAICTDDMMMVISVMVKFIELLSVNCSHGCDNVERFHELECAIDRDFVE